MDGGSSCTGYLHSFRVHIRLLPMVLSLLLLLASTVVATITHAQPVPARPLLSMRDTLQLETAAQPRPFQYPTAKDRWLAMDKAKHAGGSFLLVVSSQYALTSKAGLSQADALPLSVGVSVTVGLAKELYDWQIGSKRYFSPRDLAADGVGILLAVGFVLL